jgi:hypothetical protein
MQAFNRRYHVTTDLFRFMHSAHDLPVLFLRYDVRGQFRDHLSEPFDLFLGLLCLKLICRQATTATCTVGKRRCTTFDKWPSSIG